MTLSQLWITGLFLATLSALIFSNKRPSAIFSGLLILLLVTNTLTFADVSHHLTNNGLITLVLLLMVSAAVDKTSVIKRLARRLVVKGYKASFWRLFGLAYGASAFLNNTAVVATLIGPVKQNQHHAPSRLLIPLSYAAIFGGTLTLIGTSTNLIVDSFLIEHGHTGFNFWDFTLFGLIAGLVSAVILFVFSSRLPDLHSTDKTYKDYFIETKVEADSELIGKSVEQNHLRNLPELFLAEIIRKGRLITPVSPDFVIEQGDCLIFTGNMQKVDSLQHIDGLKLFAENSGLLNQNLTEVVISNRSRVIGKTLKEVGFRALFDAAVVAVRRDGESVSGKLGEIKLRAGDFLVLATGPDFESRHNISKNFFIVSEHNYQQKLSLTQEYLTLGGFMLAVSIAAFSSVNLAVSLVVLMGLLTFAGICTGNELKRALPINLIVVIVGALSLATALEQSGVINLITDAVYPSLSQLSPFWILVIVYIFTLLLTEMVTNNAAAALAFPFAWGICQSFNLPVLPFALAVAFAASASFISPFGYQTNLLVFSATNYKFKHFIQIGVPVSICYSFIILLLLKWQFNLA